MNQRYRLLALLFFLAIGALFLFGNPTGRSQAAPGTPDATDIVGGDPVPDPNPYVWQVSLQLEGDHICGGSVIADRWILTAAHCVVLDFDDEIFDLCSPENLDYLQNNAEVIIGVRRLSEARTSNIFNVRRCIAHEDYFHVAVGDDIALIELTRSIPDAEKYRVPLLTGTSEQTLGQAGTMSTIAGWGQTIPKNSESLPDLLRYIDLPIASQEACRSVWGEVIWEGMVCAGTIGQEVNSCQGDSGGALVVPDGTGSYIQSGITSFVHRSSCSNPNFYSVYTRVSSYIGWIEAVTGIDFTTPRAPDLVIDDIYLNDTGTLEIAIRNQGNARVALDQGFWVDLYIDPDPVPTGVNQTWNFVSDYGAVWGVDQPGFVLLPGQTVLIEWDDEVFWPTLSKLPIVEQDGQHYYGIPVGAKIYAQVDSANANTNYGAILELHELFGGSYNNIAGPYFVLNEPILVQASTENTTLSERVYLPLIVGNGNAAVAATAEETTTQPSTLSTTTLPPRVSQLEAN